MKEAVYVSEWWSGMLLFEKVFWYIVIPFTVFAFLMKAVSPLQGMFKMAGMELSVSMACGQKSEMPGPLPRKAGPERSPTDVDEPVETDPHREMPPEEEAERVE